MDAQIYEIASEVDSGATSPFLSKQWLSVLDENATNYASSQCTFSTATLSNSGKWINMSEAYFQIPLLITVSTNKVVNFAPATAATDASYSVGLKNWYGSLIHSMSVSLNGSVIIQQQGLQSILNTFKLMTTLSWSDVEKNGSTLGFYPDTCDSFISCPATGSVHGVGVVNNVTCGTAPAFGLPTHSALH